MFARPAVLLLLTLAAACGKDDGDSQSDPATTTTAPQTSSTTGTTGTPTTGSTIDTNNTDGASTMTAPETTTEGTTEPPPTSDPTATSTTSTTGEPVAFDLFRKSNAAGPCPPDTDCDGFVELLASGTLRVEKFGDLGNPVTEIDITADDLAAAVAVFTDPALLALLDGPGPLCDPPTDIFESMLVVIDGADHDATTTLCDQPPIAAARDKANELRDKYVP